MGATEDIQTATTKLAAMKKEHGDAEVALQTLKKELEAKIKAAEQTAASMVKGPREEAAKSMEAAGHVMSLMKDELRRKVEEVREVEELYQATAKQESHELGRADE